MPRKAFLKKKSLLDRFKDDYATHTGYIQSARAEHTWNNPLTRRKRTKELNRWIKSFAGKDHIHKLARFNATNAGRYESMYNEAMSLKGFLENLTEKLTKQFNLDAEKVQAYLDSHTQEMQELLDDKDLSLKEKVLFVRSEITGEKDEKKSESISVQSLIIPTNDDTWADVPDDYYPEQVACDICDGKYDDVVMHVVNSNILHKSFVVCDDCVSVAKEILEKEEHKLNKGRGYESKKSEGFALNFPCVVYKGPIEDAKKACHYVSKILADKGLGWGRVSWQAPKDGEYHYGHPEKDVYTVTLRGSNDLIKDSFAVYKDVFGNDFWNNCDADPQGWVDPLTINRYDVATPQQESNETDEKLGYEKGHKNSRGEDAPWVIRSHEDNRILASFANKKDAEEHMKRMKQYSKQESKSADELDKYIKDVKSLLKSKYNMDFNDKDTCRLNVGWLEKLDAMFYQGKPVEDGAKEVAAFCGYNKDESKKSEDADDVTYELTEDAVTDLIKELGLEIVNTWYDGNKDRIVYDCKDKGDENGETVCVWVEPPYEARVWLKDVNPRVNQLVEDIETLDALKTALVDIFKIELGESHVTESLRKPENTIIVPNWLWETYTLGENYDGDTLTDDEQQTYLDFKEKYEGFSLQAVSEKTAFRSDNDFDSNGCPCYEVNVFKK